MLTERQKLILRIVVDDYVRSAEPVGSRTIAKREGINFSPATIRNEMADLEEMGYLTQPHTSAGRIPSQKGYRFYVDNLMVPERLSKDVVEKIHRLYTERFMQFEQVIQETASVLSKLTNYTSIALGPGFFEATLKHIQLVSLTEKMAVAIIVTNTGHVEHRTVSVPANIDFFDMEKLVNLLNDKLKGVPLYQFKDRLYTEIASELKRHVSQYQAVMKMLEEVLSRDKEERVYLTGTTHIFSQPEFRDVEKARELFELLEQHDRIQDVLAGTKDKEGIQVLIGQENLEEAFSECSIITASYSIGGKPVGTLSILGPTRMDYKKVVSILHLLARDLSYYLNRVY
jgi:heat-inducible transcriptional repressor